MLVRNVWLPNEENMMFSIICKYFLLRIPDNLARRLDNFLALLRCRFYQAIHKYTKGNHRLKILNKIYINLVESIQI